MVPPPVLSYAGLSLPNFSSVVSGRLHVVTDDGTDGDVTPGCVYRIAPGHDAWVVGDEPVVVVEFQGAASYAKH